VTSLYQDAEVFLDEIWEYFRYNRIHDLDSDDHDWLERKLKEFASNAFNRGLRHDP